MTTSVLVDQKVEEALNHLRNLRMLHCKKCLMSRFCDRRSKKQIPSQRWRCSPAFSKFEKAVRNGDTAARKSLLKCP